MLTGELTNLRAVDHEDADRIHAWFDDPEAMGWWATPFPALSRHTVHRQLDAWLEDERVYGHPVAYTIETLEGDAAGLIFLSDLQLIDRSAELSVVLERNYRGRGLGGDALATLVSVAFEQWNLHRLAVRSEVSNPRAHRFFEKNGFCLEGRLRQARYIDGEWQDILIFGCVREAPVCHE